MDTTLSTFEYIVGMAGGYFLFMYFPVRLVTSPIFSKLYNKYMSYPFAYSALENSAAGAGVWVAHLLGRREGKRFPKYVKEPPKWLQYLSVFLFAHDMGFIITLLMGGFLVEW